MGRIKITLVKRTAEDLIRNHPDKLKNNFEDNKKIVEELLIIPSKKLRNLIAGATTKLVKKQEL